MDQCGRLTLWAWGEDRLPQKHSDGPGVAPRHLQTQALGGRGRRLPSLGNPVRPCLKIKNQEKGGDLAQ